MTGLTLIVLWTLPLELAYPLEKWQVQVTELDTSRSYSGEAWMRIHPRFMRMTLWLPDRPETLINLTVRATLNDGSIEFAVDPQPSGTWPGPMKGRFDELFSALSNSANPRHSGCNQVFTFGGTSTVISLSRHKFCQRGRICWATSDPESGLCPQ